MPVAWGVRLIIYIPLAILLLAWLGQVLLVRDYNEIRMDRERCEVDPRACVDARTGLIASVPDLEGRGSPKAVPHIPCRFVGVWSTRDSLRTYNLTLMEDGRLRIDDQQPGARRQTDGFWMVQSGSAWSSAARPRAVSADIAMRRDVETRNREWPPNCPRIPARGCGGRRSMR